MFKKLKNNSGFSLVELIIVIAIMAILLGFLAPQLIRYVEKTNVSADVQLCDAIHSAMLYAMADPDVLKAEDTDTDDILTTLTSGGAMNGPISYFDRPSSPYCQAVIDSLGYNPFDANFASLGLMKSSPAKSSGVLHFVTVNDGKEFIIFINNSDASGERQGHTVNNTNLNGLSDVIHAPDIYY